MLCKLGVSIVIVVVGQSEQATNYVVTASQDMGCDDLRVKGYTVGRELRMNSIQSYYTIMN